MSFMTKETNKDRFLPSNAVITNTGKQKNIFLIHFIQFITSKYKNIAQKKN